MKPFLEKLPPSPDASVQLLNRRLQDEIPFQWHHHPELELTLTLNSRGQRFIGDHIGSYDHGDLVLVGPNLPHSWNSVEKIKPDLPHVALVTWVHPDWVAALSTAMPELALVKALFDRAATGLVFSDDFAARAKPLIEQQFESGPEARLILFLQVLTLLASDENARTLSTRAILPHNAGADRSRIDRVLDYIHLHYTEDLKLEKLADLAALSLSGLHRLFRKHLNMSILDYVIRLRIGQACALLTSTQAPVSVISDQAGYQSLANFNRQFKSLRGMTPREYRQRHLTKS